MIQNMSPKLKAAMETILDCMAGGDGGVSFANLCLLLQEMDEKAKAGDPGAKEILQTPIRLAKLIEIASRHEKRQAALDGR